jgi:hypothetical protein
MQPELILNMIYLIFDFWCFNATFSNISAISWRPVLAVEEGGVPEREPPTMGKQLVNFITCGCELSAPIFVIHKAGREPTQYW